jgi:predicted nucleic acid-binding protein
MSGGDFLDSNVVVYAFNRTDPRKHQIARRLIEETPPNELAISFQVVGETLNVLTQKFTPRMPHEEAQTVLTTTLQLFWRVDPSPDLYSAALNLKDRYEYTFYDSLIIAAALEANCERLLSEDLQHGQRIDGLTIVNPFLET